MSIFSRVVGATQLEISEETPFLFHQLRFLPRILEC